MDVDSLTFLGLFAGAITSLSFIPQVIKGFQTKRLEDVSYGMLFVLASGMSLWFLYGVFRNDFAILVANGVGVSSTLLLMVMKRYYSIKKLYLQR